MKDVNEIGAVLKRLSTSRVELMLWKLRAKWSTLVYRRKMKRELWRSIYYAATRGADPDSAEELYGLACAHRILWGLRIWLPRKVWQKAILDAGKEKNLTDAIMLEGKLRNVMLSTKNAAAVLMQRERKAMLDAETDPPGKGDRETSEELKAAVRSFFRDFLDVQEQSENGRVWHPISISCARVLKAEPLDKLLKKMKKLSGVEEEKK